MKKNNTTDHSFCDSAAIRMNQGSNIIKIRKPIETHSQASSVNDSEYAYSAAAAIGSASSDENNDANIEGNNVFDIKGGTFKALALSRNNGETAQHSVATTIGAASAACNAIFGDYNVFNINDSTLIASATSNLSPVAVVIGAASGDGDVAAVKKGNTYNVTGDCNIFVAFANGDGYGDGNIIVSSAVVLGSASPAVGRGDANTIVEGKNIYSVKGNSILTAVATNSEKKMQN